MTACNIKHHSTLYRCTLPMNHKGRHTYQYGTNGPVRWRLTRAERRQRKERDAAQEGKTA
jgi:uncharacterized protein (DUF2249 family)